MPATAATPIEVVTGFSAAVTAGDYETAGSLVASPRWTQSGLVGPTPLGHYCEISGLRGLSESRPGPGLGEDPALIAFVGGRMHVVTYGRSPADETWSSSDAPDQVYDSGRFRLERADPAQPWRIAWFGGEASP